MTPGTWPNPPHADEYAVRFDRKRSQRVLIVPALFDEANKLRHLTVETMRALDQAGVDTMLPDLPGTNESCEDLAGQSLSGWRVATINAAKHFSATHLLTIRGGVLCAQSELPNIRYAPVGGAKLLRALLRAQVISDREAGCETSRELLLDQGRTEGLVLAGHTLSPAMIMQLEAAKFFEQNLPDIAQADLGGPGLWLRAEPDHDPAQAEALARQVTERLS